MTKAQMTRIAIRGYQKVTIERSFRCMRLIERNKRYRYYQVNFGEL